LRGETGIGKSLFVRKVLIPLVSLHNDSAYCYIPQNPIQMRHWYHKQLLSDDVIRYAAGSLGLDPSKDQRRYLAQCSGGQIERFYAWSAISRLSHEKALKCFLFLDETLDSSGQNMGKYIDDFCEFWGNEAKNKNLYIIIITHLWEQSIPKKFYSLLFRRGPVEERGPVTEARVYIVEDLDAGC
jgi:hypothetical protein